MTAEPGAASAHLTSQTPLLPAIHAWEIFLRDQGRSVYTVRAFIGDMQLLASFLPPDRSLGGVNTGDLNNFLTWLQKGRGIPCSPKSLARRVTSIKAFFRWLQRAGVVMVDPAVKVVQQSVVSPLPTVLTTEEVIKAVEAAMTMNEGGKADVRPYTLLALLLETGLKKGEVLGLSRNHIDLEASEGPTLYVRYASPSSRYKERRIQLTSEWISIYQQYLAQYDPPEQLFPWSPRRLEYLLEDIGKAAGLEKHISFDMCRWTCALDDWRSGVEPEKLRQKLGISKIQWREVSHKLRQLADLNP